MIRRSLAALAVVLAISGCRTSTFPDPNDPKVAGKEAPHRLLDTLAATSAEANRRVASGDISDDQAGQIVRDKARELAKGIDLSKIPAAECWRYGELFRAAQMWEQTETVLTRAVKNPSTEERRIIDSLRLAQAKANLEKFDEAIQVAGTVMEADPVECAPILPAILFEVEPLLEGQGRDAQVAKLVEQAIAAHERTIVDANSDGGKAFLAARRHHLGTAYDLAVRLYADAGDKQGEAVARAKRQRFLSDNQSA